MKTTLRLVAPWVQFALAGLPVMGTFGCPGAETCAASDECASDEQCRAGNCVPVGQGQNDAGPLPMNGDAGDAASDAGTSADGGADAGVSVCDDGDGALEHAELPLALGQPLRFIESMGDEGNGIAVDVDGAPNAQGVWTWDFSTPHASDASIELSGQPLSDFWFEFDYDVPEGYTGYVLALNGDAENYAILARNDQELLMLGVASADANVTQLVYAPPVATVRLPLVEGQTWSVETEVSGTFEGLFYTSDDSYTITTRKQGQVITPAGSFPAWQLQLELEVTIPILVFPFELTYRYVRHAFMTPCYGQVAFAASFEDEADALFDEAAELRRLGLAP